MIRTLHVKCLESNTGDITISHHMEGKDCALAKYMLELQIGHGDEDVILKSTVDKIDIDIAESIHYHMTVEQAKKWIDLFDGVRYDERVEFKTYGKMMNWREIAEIAERVWQG